MKRGLRISMALLIVLGVTALVGLRIYRLDLIEHIVVNAVIQKSPPSFPRQKIRESFRHARRVADEKHQDSLYLEFLLGLSAHLEKVQSLEEGELKELVDRLQDNSGKAFLGS